MFGKILDFIGTRLRSAETVLDFICTRLRSAETVLDLLSNTVSAERRRVQIKSSILQNTVE